MRPYVTIYCAQENRNCQTVCVFMILSRAVCYTDEGLAILQGVYGIILSLKKRDNGAKYRDVTENTSHGLKSAEY